MSEEQNVLSFPTTASQEATRPEIDTSPEALQELADKGTPEVLKLVNKNRKAGIEALQKRLENFELDLDRIRQELPDSALLTLTNDAGGVVYSLENSLRDIKAAMGGTLTTVEALNSLCDMLVHDITGLLQNVQMAQHAAVTTSNHTQTLLVLLAKKGMITEVEMQETWDEMMANQKEIVKQKLKEEADAEASASE